MSFVDVTGKLLLFAGLDHCNDIDICSLFVACAHVLFNVPHQYVLILVAAIGYRLGTSPASSTNLGALSDPQANYLPGEIPR